MIEHNPQTRILRRERYLDGPTVRLLNSYRIDRQFGAVQIKLLEVRLDGPELNRFIPEDFTFELVEAQLQLVILHVIGSAWRPLQNVGVAEPVACFLSRGRYDNNAAHQERN